MKSATKFKLRKVVPVTNKDWEPLCLNTIYLVPTKPITFGRNPAPEIKYTLMSKSTPLMISRKHATIACENDVWTIIDHKSLNGVYVNGHRIDTNLKHIINAGDTIAFGCGIKDAKAEFEYAFEATVRQPRVSSIQNQSSENILVSPPKKPRIDSIENRSILNSTAIIQTNKLLIKEHEERIKRLSEELHAKECAQNELQHRLEETEQGHIENLQKQQEGLQQERCEAEQELKSLLENQLKEKETLLRSEFDEQISVLVHERELVEASLQKELSSKLIEKDQALQTELEKQRSHLDQQLTEKEQDKYRLLEELQAKEGIIEQYKSVEENQKQLEGCLVKLRQQIEEKDDLLNKQKEDAKKIEMEAKQTVVSAMEDEFTCIICQELFINATILPCAHTFCDVCIRGWMKKKKNCPVCRRSMNVSKAVRSYAVESAIEKIVESMDDEYRERRKTTKVERENELKRENAAGNPGSSHQAQRPQQQPQQRDQGLLNVPLSMQSHQPVQFQLANFAQQQNHNQYFHHRGQHHAGDNRRGGRPRGGSSSNSSNQQQSRNRRGANNDGYMLIE